MQNEIIRSDITQSEFYKLPAVVAANEVLKRTPRNHPDNRAAFETIVREMAKYNVPAGSKWTMADY